MRGILVRRGRHCESPSPCRQFDGIDRIACHHTEQMVRVDPGIRHQFYGFEAMADRDRLCRLEARRQIAEQR